MQIIENPVEQAALLLESAAFVLLVPEWHTKRQFARTREHSGQVVNPLAPNADCFCAAGALQAAAHELGDGGGLALAVEELIATINVPVWTKQDASIAYWNDKPETTPEHVAQTMLETATRVRLYDI